MTSSPVSTPAAVLDFWFTAHGEDDWFAARPEFDALIASTFSDTLAALARGEGQGWRTTPEGRLAEIIVLDQFARQIHRGRAAAFATDPIALILAQECVGGGHHHFLPPRQRSFALLPFMHSESARMQRESVRLFTALGNPDQLRYAEAHAAVIARFGRFPKRNVALGRASTPEELAYIAGTPGLF